MEVTQVSVNSMTNNPLENDNAFKIINKKNKKNKKINIIIYMIIWYVL